MTWRSPGTVAIIAKYREIYPVFKWLILDPLHRFRRDVGKVMAFQAGSTIFIIAGFLVVIKFLNFFLDQSALPAPFEVAGLENHREALFWAVVAASLLFLLTGAAFNYYARKITARLARLTEERVLVLLTEALVRNFSAYSDNNPPPANQNILKSFYSRGGRYAGRMVMAVTTTLIPLVSMLLSMAYLCYLKPGLTALLIFLLLAAAPLFVSIAAKGRRSSEDLLKHARNATLDKNRILDLLLYAMFRPEIFRQEDARRINSTPAATGFMDAYERRLRITALSTFFTRTVIALMLTTILLAAIYPVIRGEKPAVTEIMLYLATFKFFGGGLVAVINAYVTLNVFYSYCRSLAPFLQPAPPPGPRKTERVEKYRLDPGHPVAVNLYTPVDWSNIPLIIHRLAGQFTDLDPGLIADSCLLSPHIHLLGQDHQTWARTAGEGYMERLVADLQALPMSKKIFRKKLRHLRPESFSSEGWQKVAIPTRMLAKAMILKDKPGPLPVFVDGGGLLAASIEEREQLFSLLAKHQVVVVFPGCFTYKSIPAGTFGILACISQEDLEWIGDFEQARQENIRLAPLDCEKDAAVELDMLEEF